MLVYNTLFTDRMLNRIPAAQFITVLHLEEVPSLQSASASALYVMIGSNFSQTSCECLVCTLA